MLSGTMTCRIRSRIISASTAATSQLTIARCSAALRPPPGAASVFHVESARCDSKAARGTVPSRYSTRCALPRDAARLNAGLSTNPSGPISSTYSRSQSAYGACQLNCMTNSSSRTPRSCKPPSTVSRMAHPCPSGIT